MSEPGQATGRRVRALSRRLTVLQFIIFAGTGLVGLAALLAAGLALGVALAGAAILAVLALAAWFIAANLLDAESPVIRRRPPAG